MHIGLLRPLIAKMIKKENSDKRHNRGLSYLLCRAQKVTNLDDIMDSSYLTLLESVLSSGLWNEFIEDSGIEQFITKLELFPIPNFYYSKYSFQEKSQIIMLLISMLLDSMHFYQEITKRTERLESLRKEKHELHNLIRSSLKSKKVKEMKSEISEINLKLEQVITEMKDIRTRSECIGKDRYFNEYYIFPWDKRYLFVKSFKPIQGKGKESESGY